MVIAKFNPFSGGLQKQVFELSRNLVKRGINVFIITRKFPHDNSCEDLEGIKIIRFPIFGRMRLIQSMCFIIFSLLWLIKNSKNYELIHCHQAYSPATIGALAKIILKKKVIVKITASNEFGEVGEIKKLPLFNIRKWLLRKIDIYAVVNTHIIKEWECLGIGTNNLIYIPNGVSIYEETAFNNNLKDSYKKSLKLPYKKIVIFTGRLSYEKSLDTLLFAWKEIIQKVDFAHLVILGEGGKFRNVEKELKNLSRDLKLTQSIHFLGKVSNIENYLLASDIFVLPSLSEGLSNALLEAMSAGLGIVTTKIDANLDIIRHKENGIMVEAKDSIMLSKAIIEMLENDSLCIELGKNARRDAEAKFDINIITDRYINLYKQVLKN